MKKKGNNHKPHHKQFPFAQEKNLYYSEITSRRSGKTVDLLTDDISLGSYQPSSFISGYQTEYPLLWLEAFESFFSQTFFNILWLNYADESGKFFESVIQLHNSKGIKTFTIHIYLSTGVVLFKGKCQNAWLDSYFRQIQKSYQNLLILYKTSLPVHFNIQMANINTNNMNSAINGAPYVTPLSVSSSSVVSDKINTNKTNNNNKIKTPSTAVPVTLPAPVSVFLSQPVSVATSVPICNFSNISLPVIYPVSNLPCSSFVNTNTAVLPETSACANSCQILSTPSITAFVTHTSPLRSDDETPSPDIISNSNFSSFTADNESSQSFLQNDTEFSFSTTKTQSAQMKSNPIKQINLSDGSLHSASQPLFSHDSASPVFTSNNTTALIFQQSPISYSSVQRTSSIYTSTVTPYTKSVYSFQTTSKCLNAPRNLFPNQNQCDENSLSSICDQLSSLWDENKKNRAALENVQTGISNITSQLAGIKSLVTNTKSSLQSEINNLESRIDDKISSMSNIINDTWDKKLRSSEEKLAKSFDKELNAMKKNMERRFEKFVNGVQAFESDTNKKFSELPEKSKNLELLEKKVADFDVDSLNAMSDQLTEACEAIKCLKNKNSILNTEISNIKSFLLKHNEKSEKSAKSSTYKTSSASVDNKTDNVEKNTSIPNNKTKKSDNSILFFMDSNRKILNFNRLWDPSKTKFVSTGTFFDLEKNVNKYVNNNTNCVVIHCGTNDLDTKSPHQVCNEMDEIISDIFRINPDVQVILSELLPRSQRDIDDDVCEINETFHDWYFRERNIFLLKHDKFRQQPHYMLRDDRHLQVEAAPIFAASFKFALRKCVRIDYDNDTANTQNNKTPEKSESVHSSSGIASNEWLSNSSSASPVALQLNSFKKELLFKLTEAIKSVLE